MGFGSRVGSMVRPMLSRLTRARANLRARLNESLFLPAPEPAHRLGRWETALVVVAFLVLAIVLQLLRVGPSEALDSIWAEDGVIFLQEARINDLLTNLFDPYAGYLVLVPRMIGEIGAAVPLRDAAAAITISAALVTALCGLAVWYASAGLVRSPILRGTLVALAVLAPTASLETVASGSYVLWYMLFATFWLLLWRPASAAGTWLGAALILLTGLSTPGVWFFAPLALLRAISARDRRDAMIVGAWALGAVAQLPVIALNDEPQIDPQWSHEIWTAYLQRVLDGAVLGEALGGEAWELLGWALLIGLAVAAVAALLACLLRSPIGVRVFVALAVLTSLVMFVFSVYQRAVGAQMAWPPDIHFGNAGRYALVPALLLASALIVAVDAHVRRRAGSQRGTWAAIAVAGALLVGLVGSFDLSEPKYRGEPPWGESLDAAGEACVSENLEAAPVPTSPPPFGVLLPCTDLPGGSDAAPAR